MEFVASRKFSFIANSLLPDTFEVVSFQGTERISAPYRFEILLVSDNMAVDFKSVINNEAKLVLHREDGDILYHGIVANFEQLHETDGYSFYRAHLVPRFWWLSIVQHNQVFLNKTVVEFLEEILKDGGLTDLDFEFRLRNNYDPVEFVCQYGETHLNFLSRWCEREGIYYYFEQLENREMIIFTDTMVAHKEGGNVVYSPPSGLQAFHLHEALMSFQCRKNVLPAKVLMKDYNYRRPSLEVEGTADVDKNGRGTVYFYHEHFRTSEEGKRLAGIRAESILCRSEEYYGASSTPSIRTGYTFDVTRHFRDDFNSRYLAVEVTHEGDQSDLFPIRINPDPAPEQHKMFYLNHFTAIPAATQFRSQITAQKPTVSGSIVATIDAEGSGQYAELDEMGRYKVNIPFDISGKQGGKASSWIRMAQPYGGSKHGMHFPLQKGTEVLLTFVNGDPDRPIITAAVPNPAMPSLVTSANQTANIIHTSGGNKIHLEDREGSQHLLLHSPAADSMICLGLAPTPAPDEGLPQGAGSDPNWVTMKPFTPSEGIGIHLATSKWIDVKAQFVNELAFEGRNSVCFGERFSFVTPIKINVIVGAYSKSIFGLKHEFVYPEKWQFSGTQRVVSKKINDATKTRTDIINDIKSIIEKDTKVVGEKLVIAQENKQLAERRSLIIGDEKEVVQQRTNVTKDELNAVEKQVYITNTAIENIKQSLVNVENQVEKFGTQIIEANQNITRLSTEIKEVNISKLSADVIVEQFQLKTQQ